MFTPNPIIEHFNTDAAVYESRTGGCTRELAEHCIGLAEDIKPIDDKSNASTVQPEIHAVDGPENMVRIRAERIPSGTKAHTATMMGEELAFPDGTFSHSFTNMGLMFFADPAKGAKEIWRTLQPGGVAVVTTWTAPRNVNVIRDVQMQIKPEDPPFQVPVFRDIQVSEVEVHFGAETAEVVADILMKGMGAMVFAAWTDDEKKKARKLTVDAVNKVRVSFTRGGGQGVRIQLRAGTIIGQKE
ncbi:Methyltransf-25 domain-containing protein [Fusarium falciforme]|uniref:Methyltransf-25 domain-containing protein n=1 Tax=Fusarium falciforme TaxID=195108 RepID=UPI00230033A7|nr:Methyltransf-25 domain-containing protein [Fusarium falciforme]WAO95358.1 Methyltransf-25 domain-containing protein [Fusarium falciforme]